MYFSPNHSYQSTHGLTDYDRGQVISTTFNNFIDDVLLLSSLGPQTEVLDCVLVLFIAFL